MFHIADNISGCKNSKMYHRTVRRDDIKVQLIGLYPSLGNLVSRIIGLQKALAVVTFHVTTDWLIDRFLDIKSEKIAPLAPHLEYLCASPNNKDGHFKFFGEGDKYWISRDPDLYMAFKNKDTILITFRCFGFSSFFINQINFNSFFSTQICPINCKNVLIVFLTVKISKSQLLCSLS